MSRMDCDIWSKKVVVLLVVEGGRRLKPIRINSHSGKRLCRRAHFLTSHVHGEYLLLQLFRFLLFLVDICKCKASCLVKIMHARLLARLVFFCSVFLCFFFSYEILFAIFIFNFFSSSISLQLYRFGFCSNSPIILKLLIYIKKVMDLSSQSQLHVYPAIRPLPVYSFYQSSNLVFSLDGRSTP